MSSNPDQLDLLYITQQTVCPKDLIVGTHLICLWSKHSFLRPVLSELHDLLSCYHIAIVVTIFKWLWSYLLPYTCLFFFFQMSPGECVKCISGVSSKQGMGKWKSQYCRLYQSWYITLGDFMSVHLSTSCLASSDIHMWTAITSCIVL